MAGQSYLAKLYVGNAILSDANTVDDVTWGEVEKVADLNAPLTTDDIDATTRAGGGFKEHLPGLQDAEITFTMKPVGTDADFESLRDAWLNRTLTSFAALSGDKDTVGSQGIAGNFYVTNMEIGEAIADMVQYNFTLKPYSQLQWWEVEAS